MAIQYYVNDNLVNIQSNAAFLSTQDESLDTGTLVLEWNNMPNALLPQTKFKIVDTDNNETWNFIIKRDEVELIQRGNIQIWQHNLTVEQNTSGLSKKVIRDSNFIQPVQNKVLTIHSHGYLLVKYNTTAQQFQTDGIMHLPLKSYNPDTVGYYRNRILIEDREKISGAVVKVESCTQRFLNIATTMTQRMIMTRTVEQISYQNHGRIPLSLKMYNAPTGGSLINSYDFYVEEGQEYAYLGDDAYMGDGWYELQYDGDIYFSNLTQDEIRFTRNTQDIFDDTYYPSVLGMISIEMKLNTYYYSLWDILNILRKQQMKTFCYISHEESPYEMPTGDAKNYLSRIVAPEFKYNSSDLYSAVAEVFSYIDAIPTIDNDGVLGWEFLNNLNGKVLEERYDKKRDQKTMIEDTYFVDAVVTNYQNAKQETKIEYPARNVYKRISSNVTGVPSPENYIMEVPHRIDYIDNVYVNVDIDFELEFNVRIDVEGYAQYNAVSYHSVILPHGRINIRDAIYEASLYETLEIGSESSYEPNRNNTLFYNRETNFINCGGLRDSYDHVGDQFVAIDAAITMCMRLLFTSFSTWSLVIIPNLVDIWKIQYNIEYHGIFDGRVKEENRQNRCQDTGLFVAQASSSADLNKMGTNMLGVISKLGNEERNVQLDMSSYGNRIKKGTQYEDLDGQKWVITNVKTTFSTSSGKVFNECTLSKNYNSIGKFTSVNQEKRFYEISEKLTSKGYENITEYIYFSALMNIGLLEVSCIEILALQTIFNKTLGYGTGTYSGAQYATIQTYDKAQSISTDRKEVLIPMHSYGLGNAICFEMGFENSLSAGTVLRNDATTGKPLFNEVILYSGDKGFSDKFDINIYGRETFYASDEFPVIPNGFNLPAQKLFEIPEMYYYKRPNEILHINYSIQFLPFAKKVDDSFGVPHYEAEEIFIGKEFIDKNAIVSNTQSLGRLYLYLSNDEQYTISDLYCKGDRIDVASIEVTISSNKSGVITVTIPSAPQYDEEKGISWAIGTEDGKLVFGINQIFDYTKTWHLYFSASGKKLY